MFVNKEERCETIKFDGVEYAVYYVEISALEDDRILEKALQMERGRTRGSISARSRIASINRERFLATIRRVEYADSESGESKVVQMDASVYPKLSRGFRDIILGEIIEPVTSPDKEDEGDFTESPTLPSTESL